MSVSSRVLDKGVALLTEHGALVDAAKIPIGRKFGSSAKLVLLADTLPSAYHSTRRETRRKGETGQ